MLLTVQKLTVLSVTCHSNLEEFSTSDCEIQTIQQHTNQPYSKYKHSLTCRIRICHSNETRALIANLPNSTQLGGTPYHSQSYTGVHAVVLECSEGQTDRHTDGRGQYTFRHGYASHKM